MIRSGTILMIREKAQSGKSAYAIAKEIGLSKNTVKKYIAPATVETSNLARNQPSKLDSYKDLIHACMAAGIFNCRTIFERIRDKGYTGGITILKDYVKPYRPPKACLQCQGMKAFPGNKFRWITESATMQILTEQSIRFPYSL